MKKKLVLLVLVLNLGFGAQNFGAVTREEKEKIIEEINRAYEKPDNDKLIRLVTRYLSLYPNDANYLNRLGVLYENKNNYAEAEKSYLKAIEKGNLTALENLAYLYQEQKKYDKSIKYYQEYLKYIEKDTVYSNLGWVYEETGKLEEAKKYFMKSAEIGKDGYAENRLGLIYDETYGNQKEALKWYLKSAEKGNYTAQRNLAILYLNMEDYREAEKWIKKAIEEARKKNDTEDIAEFGEILKDIQNSR